MKKVLVIRHAQWDLSNDALTPDGVSRASEVRNELPQFATVYASPAKRTQQTAELLSGQQPQVDDRAGTPSFPKELQPEIRERRKTHALGVAGVLFELPAAQSALQRAGEQLRELVQEVLSKLDDGQNALIVTHDGTLVCLEKTINNEPFDSIDHSFGELEGLWVDGEFAVQVFRPGA